MTIGILGYGFVGSHLAALLDATGLYELCLFDKYDPAYNSSEQERLAKRANLTFLCVPTPSDPVSGECDLSFVEEALLGCTGVVCLKSTVPPGTTDLLKEKFGVPVVFSPEYIGETPYHPSRQPGKRPELVVVGGQREAAQRVIAVFKEAVGPEARYFLTEAVTAELAKYMENCFFATKLAFVSEFQQLALRFHADPEMMREIWVSDSRVGTSHSIALGDRAFGGKCLPKDLAALLYANCQLGGEAPLLAAVQLLNQNHKK